MSSNLVNKNKHNKLEQIKNKKKKLRTSNKVILKSLFLHLKVIQMMSKNLLTEVNNLYIKDGLRIKKHNVR